LLFDLFGSSLPPPVFSSRKKLVDGDAFVFPPVEGFNTVYFFFFGPSSKDPPHGCPLCPLGSGRWNFAVVCPNFFVFLDCRLDSA